MKKGIITAIILLAAAAASTLYFYDIFKNGTPYTEYLFRYIAFISVMIATLIRVFGGAPRLGKRSYMAIELEYKKELGNAFAERPAQKKRLLRAIGYYNLGAFERAIRILARLKPMCDNKDEVYAVGLFLAESLDELGASEAAISTYLQMIDIGVYSSQLYNNLGNIYSKVGDEESSLSYLTLALQHDPENSYALNNIAHYHFRKKNIDSAIEYALRSLQCNSTLASSASLLAICYSIKGKNDLASKYIHTSVALGTSRERLDAAIDRYVNDDDDDTDIDDDEVQEISADPQSDEKTED